MQAGNFPVNNHSRTMEISLFIFCAVMINLLFSDCAVMIAATHVSPLSSGISSESYDEPSRWARTTLSHIEGRATGHLRFRAARLAYALCQSCMVVVSLANVLTCLVYS